MNEKKYKMINKHFKPYLAHPNINENEKKNALKDRIGSHILNPTIKSTSKTMTAKNIVLMIVSNESSMLEELAKLAPVESKSRELPKLR